MGMQYVLIYVHILEQVNPFTNMCQLTVSFGQCLLKGICAVIN